MDEKSVYNLLHDLGTPLTVVKNLVYVLLENKSISADPESRKMLEEIQSQNEKAVNIILGYRKNGENRDY